MNTYESYILLSQHFDSPDSEKQNLDIVGQKALGLFSCQQKITPPFFVIKSTLFRLWIDNNAAAEKFLKYIILNISSFFHQEPNTRFIVRSSAKFETFEERGFYKSSNGNINAGHLYEVIIEVWKQNIYSFSKYENNEFAVIIQNYVKPKLSGHLSNERRISRNSTDWLIEIVNQKGEFVEGRKFSIHPTIKPFTEQLLFCTNKRDLIAALQSIALSGQRSKRIHIEWVWDGNRLWIVQKDIEVTSTSNEEPGSQWEIAKNIIEERALSCLNTVSNTISNWKKIKCIKTFLECKLPYGNVYILENSAIIANLAHGRLDIELQEDLEWLLFYPIVIRMDIAKNDNYSNVLLPRTETIFTLNQAIDFLFEKSKSFTEHELKPTDFCFLIHRFIVSKSCALAFSKPNIQKARIDSTWGIVDGLYYHPHDSYEVSMMNNPPQIKKQIRCKTEYLDVNSSGKWFSKKSGTKWDWAESLTKKQLLEITSYNIKIADYLDSPVTVMYFVDVDQNTGYPSILPWFYTVEEITESSEKFTDVIFSQQRELIQNEDDFNSFKTKSHGIETSKLTIKLKLTPDTLRDKELIEKIGEFAKIKNIPIELEGSILSHTYYILRKKEARVKCIDLFEPKHKKQKFYKLVRDKIPVNIESKGEKARTVKINSQELLNFLKVKSIEEAYEFYWEKEEDKIIEELADIYEVIRASCKIFGIEIEELEKIADKKSEKKGGFENGVVLLDTMESSLIDIIDSTGKSLLIDNNVEIKLDLQNVKKNKHRKIAFGLDNSITLPYMIPGQKNLINDVSAPVSFEDIQSLKISYTNKGIKIKFENSEKDKLKNNQLNLFND